MRCVEKATIGHNKRETFGNAENIPSHIFIGGEAGSLWWRLDSIITIGAVGEIVGAKGASTIADAPEEGEETEQEEERSDNGDGDGDGRI